MPASPKATVVGLGAAAIVTALVFVVPAVVLTGYFGQVSERQRLVDATQAAIRTLRLHGVERDTLPDPVVQPLGTTGYRLFPIVGELAAWDSFRTPPHRQPPEAIVWLAGPAGRPAPLSPDEFAADEDPISGVVGEAGSRGIPVAFADGTVWLLRESTPCSAVRPFLTRNTLVKLKRDQWLAPFRLRPATDPKQGYSVGD